MDLTLGILNPAFLTLGVSQWVIGPLIVGFLACSILLILTVLIQRPQGGGLSGAFGAGAGSGETAFGARTGDALTIATISFFVLWLAVAVGLVLVMSEKPGAAPTTQVGSNEGPIGPGESTGGEGQAEQQPGGEQAPAEDGAGTPTGDENAEPPADEGAGAPGGDTPPPAGEGDGVGDPAGDSGGGETGNTGGGAGDGGSGG